MAIDIEKEQHGGIHTIPFDGGVSLAWPVQYHVCYRPDGRLNWDQSSFAERLRCIPRFLDPCLAERSTNITIKNYRLDGGYPATCRPHGASYSIER